MLESLAVEIGVARDTFIFVSIYFPGSSDSATIRNFINDIRLLLSLGRKVIIAGDFNARHQFWGCSRSNSAGRKLYQEMSNDMFSIYYPDSPSFFPDNRGAPSVLDFFIVKGMSNVNHTFTSASLPSDHLPVHTSLTFGTEIDLQPSADTFKDYSSADWRLFQSMVNEAIPE